MFESFAPLREACEGRQVEKAFPEGFATFSAGNERGDLRGEHAEKVSKAWATQRTQRKVQMIAVDGVFIDFYPPL
jgi:hypothetical protein